MMVRQLSPCSAANLLTTRSPNASGSCAIIVKNSRDRWLLAIEMERFEHDARVALGMREREQRRDHRAVAVAP